MKNKDQERRIQMLEYLIGPVVWGLLHEEGITDIHVNPNGCILAERNETAVSELLPETYDEDRRRAIISIVASSVDRICNAENPRLYGEMPGTGARFQGMVEPTSGPAFSIRRHLPKALDIDDFIEQGILSRKQVKGIRQAVKNRQSILLSGDTGSGKTTLANSILALMAWGNRRIVSIEDTLELIGDYSNFVQMKARDTDDTRRLIVTALRLNPAWIVIGEVREGPVALESIKAIFTGHPGLSTVHALGLRKTMERMEQLIGEVMPNVPRYDIASAYNILIFLKKNGATRKAEMAKVHGLDENGGYELEVVG